MNSFVNSQDLFGEERGEERTSIYPHYFLATMLGPCYVL